MVWEGMWNTSFKPPMPKVKPSKPESKFNGLQDMTGIDKALVVVETEADRVARKLARTREIVTQAQQDAQKHTAIPRCVNCVWNTTVRKGSTEAVQRCRQPLVSDMKVKNGNTTWHDVLPRTAREDVNGCGPNGDLFIAKTWWESHRADVMGIALAALIFAIVAAIFTSLIMFFGWTVVWHWLVGIIFVIFFLAVLGITGP